MATIDDAKGKAKEAMGEMSKGMEGLNKAAGIFDKTVLHIAGSLARLALPTAVIEDTAKLQELSFKLTRDVMGQTDIIGNAVLRTMGDAAMETTKFGVGLDENLQLMKEINDVMQTNTLLSDQQVVNMQLLARTAGVTSSEIVPIVEGFRSIGVGTDDAIENIESMQKQARSYGINVGQFIKGIGANIKLLSSYNFKDGVDGLSRMVAKAQALRIDVGKTIDFADSLMDPEKAIETAAGFQMLGGAIGDLGDPFKLLQMAQTDAEGLQDAVLNMAESAVVFNEETGEFDIPVNEMYRLREAANLAGMSYQEMTDTAFKAAERTKKLDLMDTTSVPEEFKELVTNMSNLKGGKLEVAIPVYDELTKGVKTLTKGVDELTPEDLIALQEQEAINNMDMKDIAFRQMTALELMAGMDASAKAATVKIGVNTKGVTDALGALDAYAKVTKDALDESLSSDSLEVYGNALSEALATGFREEDAVLHFKNAASHIATTMYSHIKDLPTNIDTELPETNMLKGQNIFGTLVTAATGAGEELDKVAGKLKGLIPAGALSAFTSSKLAITGIGEAWNKMVDEAKSTVLGALDDVTSGVPNTSPDTKPAGDFISRPGMGVQRFRKDDIIMGGTNLFGGMDKLSDFVMNNINNENNNNTRGEIKLIGEGQITVNIEGNKSDIDINTLLKNPEFTSGIVKQINNTNNTYS